MSKPKKKRPHKLRRGCKYNKYGHIRICLTCRSRFDSMFMSRCEKCGGRTEKVDKGFLNG